MRSLLRHRSPLIGAWSVTGSPIVAEAIMQHDFDYICFDQQHGYIGLDSLLSLMQLTSSRSPRPMVRVPALETGWISKALDYGAQGIIVPMVNTAQQAAAAVSACRFPPEGERSYAATRGTSLIGGTPADGNANVACIPMIETVEALENLHDICSVSGVDALYVGLGDLALSLGETPRVALQPGRHLDAIRRIGDACREFGIGLGTHCLPGQPMQDYIEAGFTFLSVFSDIVGLRASASAAVADARGHNSQDSSVHSPT